MTWHIMMCCVCVYYCDTVLYYMTFCGAVLYYDVVCCTTVVCVYVDILCNRMTYYDVLCCVSLHCDVACCVESYVICCGGTFYVVLLCIRIRRHLSCCSTSHCCVIRLREFRCYVLHRVVLMYFVIFWNMVCCHVLCDSVAVCGVLRHVGV